MGKDISFKNHDRFIHLGIAIAALRKMRGMSQEQLAEKAGISRSLISAIEAPGLAKSFSLDVFFNLADALDIDPADLINATVFPDRIFTSLKGVYMEIEKLNLYRDTNWNDIKQYRQV